MATGKVYAVKRSDSSATVIDIVAIDFLGNELNTYNITIDAGLSTASMRVAVSDDENIIALYVEDRIYSLVGGVQYETVIDGYYAVLSYANSVFVLHVRSSDYFGELQSYASSDGITWSNTGTHNYENGPYETFWSSSASKYYFVGYHCYEGCTGQIKYDATYNIFAGTLTTIYPLVDNEDPTPDFQNGFLSLLIDGKLYTCAMGNGRVWGLCKLDNTTITHYPCSVAPTVGYNMYTYYHLYVNTDGVISVLLQEDDDPYSDMTEWTFSGTQLVPGDVVGTISGFDFTVGSVVERFAPAKNNIVSTTGGYAYLEKYVYAAETTKLRIITPTSSVDIPNSGAYEYISYWMLSGDYEAGPENFWTEETECAEYEYDYGA